jgi:hypothetical protein
MPLSEALFFCHFQGFEMSWIILYPLTMPWKCGYCSGGETLPFDKASD